MSPGSVELHAVIVTLSHESDFILDPDQPVHEITHDRIALEVGMILAESKKSVSHCAIGPDGSIDFFRTEVLFLQDSSQAGNVPMELPFVLKISFGYRFKVWDQVHSLLQGNLDIGVGTLDPVAEKHQIVKHQNKRAQDQTGGGGKSCQEKVTGGVRARRGKKEGDKHHDSDESKAHSYEPPSTDGQHGFMFVAIGDDKGESVVVAICYLEGLPFNGFHYGRTKNVELFILHEVILVVGSIAACSTHRKSSLDLCAFRNYPDVALSVTAEERDLVRPMLDGHSFPVITTAPRFGNFVAHVTAFRAGKRPGNRVTLPLVERDPAFYFRWTVDQAR